MSGRSLWQLCLDWLLVTLAVMGSVLTLTTNPAFGLPTPELLFLLVPLFGLILCLLFTPKWGGGAALGVLGFLLLTGYLLRRELLESFRNLWGVLSYRYALGYDQVRDYLPREPWSPKDAGSALITLALAETYLVCLSVRRWKRMAPGAAALLLCVGPCFVLTDTPPKLLPLLTVVFSLLTQAFSQSVRRRAAGEEGRSVALSALAAAGLLGALLLLFPQKGYSQPVTWDQLSQRMQRWTQERNNQGNVNAGLAGNPPEVNLAGLGALPNQPLPALNVSSTESGRLYLRGASYSGFDGVLWSRGTEWEGGENALYPYLNYSQYKTATLTVEPLVEEPVLFTTYQVVSLPGGGHLVGDAYLARDGANRPYSMRYVATPDPGAPNHNYELWVLSHNVELPDSIRPGLQSWWDSHAERSRFYSNQDLAEYAADLVRQCAEYSRTPDRMPEGADFCSWFLNEAEKGYCVHFASCCTALLRHLGIPARYVTGYICSAEAFRTVQVTSLQAHAWVEIYEQGRWIPIEPTPDDATEFTGFVEPVGPGGTGATAPVVTAPPLPNTQETTQEPTETQAPTQPADTQPSETQPGPNQGQGSGSGGSGFWKWLGRLLLLALRICALPALVLGRRWLVLRHRDRQLRRSRGNARALLLYRQLKRLCRHSKSPIPPEAEALAKKACFSQHELDGKELDYLRRSLEQQRNRLAICGFWRRVWYRYGLILI